MACPLCVKMADRPAYMDRMKPEDVAHAGLVMGWTLARAAKDEDLCPTHREAMRRIRPQVDETLERAGLPKPLIVLV